VATGPFMQLRGAFSTERSAASAPGYPGPGLGYPGGSRCKPVEEPRPSSHPLSRASPVGAQARRAGPMQVRGSIDQLPAPDYATTAMAEYPVSGEVHRRSLTGRGRHPGL
jgi:hypothetical protein